MNTPWKIFFSIMKLFLLPKKYFFFPKYEKNVCVYTILKVFDKHKEIECLKQKEKLSFVYRKKIFLSSISM